MLIPIPACFGCGLVKSRWIGIGGDNMCGIAGYVDFKTGPDEITLAAMEAALSHRGPDEGELRRLGPCGLAHRRLKIIDLSPAAAQPMSNEDGRLWVIFNGEIYNFHSLREELLRLGHQFRN